MSQSYLTFEFPIDKALRLSAVEEVLSEVINPPPSRSTLLNWIDEGKLEGKHLSFGWVVYESSVRRFVQELQPAA
jgi:hypothetical protein